MIGVALISKVWLSSWVLKRLLIRLMGFCRCGSKSERFRDLMAQMILACTSSVNYLVTINGRLRGGSFQ